MAEKVIVALDHLAPSPNSKESRYLRMAFRAMHEIDSPEVSESRDILVMSPTSNVAESRFSVLANVVILQLYFFCLLGLIYEK